MLSYLRTLVLVFCDSFNYNKWILEYDISKMALCKLENFYYKLNDSDVASQTQE